MVETFSQKQEEPPQPPPIKTKMLQQEVPRLDPPPRPAPTLPGRAGPGPPPIPHRKSRVSRPCDICSGGDQNEAIVFCIECDRMLCSIHVDKHNMILPTHALTPLGGRSPKVTQCMCANHSNESAIVYCHNCKIPICTSCTMNEHMEHSRVDINSIIKQSQDGVQSIRVNYEKAIITVKQSLDTTRTHIKAKSEEVKGLRLTLSQDISKEVQFIIAHAVKVLGDQADVMMNAFDARADDFLKSLGERMSHLAMTLSRLESDINTISSLQGATHSQVISEYTRLVANPIDVAENQPTQPFFHPEFRSNRDTTQHLDELQLGELSFEDPMQADEQLHVYEPIETRTATTEPSQIQTGQGVCSSGTASHS